MKKKKLLPTLIILITISIQAQIPNSGFENWTTVSTTTANYEIPDPPWKTFNSYSTGIFYPVTKSSDHYPLGVGNYSIRIQSDTSIFKLIPPAHAGGIGMAWTTLSTTLGPGVAFPITGHPNTFCGYYKFIPQNGDSMVIMLILFKNGQSVSQATFSTKTSAPNWSPFEIPINTYTDADSATIMLGSFYCFPGYSPRGNSILYVDNLSFDKLITSVLGETDSDLPLSLRLHQNYPNPFNPSTTITYTIPADGKVLLKVFDILGREVTTLVDRNTTAGKHSIVWDGTNFSSGIYFYNVKFNGQVLSKKMLFVK